MSIVKADAFANAAGVVLDTFRFVDLYRTLELNPSEADRLKSNLVDVLRGRMELDKLMRGRIQAGTAQKPKVTIPTQLRFDDTSSSHSTLLELITHDRPGLLYQVSSVLAELGCNIEIALIDTEGEKVIDVFYLTSQGRKLLPETAASHRKDFVVEAGTRRRLGALMSGASQAAAERSRDSPLSLGSGDQSWPPWP